MITIRSPLKKTLLLLTLTTLTISLGTALEWERPSSDNKHINGSFNLNVSGETGLSVEFYYDNGNGWDNIGTASENSGYYTTQLSNTDLGSTEGLDLKANTSSTTSGDNETDPRTVTYDKGAPSVSSTTGSNYLSEDPTVTFDVSDDFSEVIEVSATANSGDDDVSIDGDSTKDVNCSAGDTCQVSFDVDTSDLNDGDEFRVEATATDEVGKTGSDEPSFTIDNSWDGDSSASVEWSESESSVLSGFEDEDQDVDISFTPDSVSDTSLTCEIDGDEVDADSVGASEDEETASCEFDSDDYASSVFDLVVEAEDEAGNSQTLVDGEELVWDTSAPNVDELSQPEGVSTFNSGFDLDLVATDDASGIESLEYYFDSDTDLGNGNQVDLDSSGSTSIEKTFSVAPGDLGRGSQTVYVRVEDGAGETNVESFDFEYYPDAEADIQLGVPSSLEVTSGSSKSFTLSIENGAPFFLNGVEVTGNGAVWDGVKTASDLESGDSVEKTITVDASNLDVGVYNLTLETANYDSSSTVEVVVRATDSQKQSIEQTLSEWESKKSSLEENISSIGTLETSNANVTGFTQKVSDARTAVDNGEYYKAKSILENINSSFSQASDTYSVKLDEHKKNKRNQLFMILFGGVAILGIGAAGTVVYLQREDGEKLEEILPEDIEFPDLLPEELPEVELVDKFKEAIESAEEEVEEETGYEFEGFN